MKTKNLKTKFQILLVLFLLGLTTISSAKTLRVAYDADPVTLDPHAQLSGGILQHSHLVFDPLIRWNAKLGFDNRLATSYERINDKTIRFKLRKGVKFHSGNSFSAKDVKYTVERLKKSPDFKAIFDPVAEVKVIDEYTVDLISKEVYPLLINTATYIFPLDSKFYAGKDEIVKNGDSFANSNSSGTGPFTVTERQQGVKIVYTKFDKYWDKNRGNVDEIVLTPISENGTRTAALLSGDVDFIAPVSPNDFGLIRKSSKAKLITMSGTRIITFQLNSKKQPAFADPRVRQAFVYAVNNKGIVAKIMRKFGTPAAQMSPKGYQGYNSSLKPRYDLKKAKQLMKDAGYEKGFSITMMAPNNRYVNDEKIAQAVSSMLAKINVKVDLKTLPKAQYWPEFDKRAADVMMIGWHADTEDTANFFEFLLACPNKETGWGAYNSGNYCNKKLDDMIRSANRETDSAKRANMLQAAEKIAYDDAAHIPLHWQDLSWASAKNVEAEKILNVLNFPYFGNLNIK